MFSFLSIITLKHVFQDHVENPINILYFETHNTRCCLESLWSEYLVDLDQNYEDHHDTSSCINFHICTNDKVSKLLSGKNGK